MSPRRRSMGALLAALTLTSCENAGSGRVLGLDATGVVRGSVVFDANGSGSQDAEDVPFAGAGIRLLAAGSHDTLRRATTGADGTFLLSGVPVGTYRVLLDSASAGDSATVTDVDVALVRIDPGDTAVVRGTIGFPLVTAAEVRTLPLGMRVFVTGIALHARTTFSDTLLHLADTSGTIRAIRVRPSAVVAGDSVRLRARISMRLGERALDDVYVFGIAPAFLPTAAAVTTAQAATAVGGTLDASLVSILDAAIADTATVGGHLTVTMDDGSGPVTVVLDRAADPAFRPPLPASTYDAMRRFDIVGVLVPTGAGAWRVRPRSALDLTPR